MSADDNAPEQAREVEVVRENLAHTLWLERHVEWARSAVDPWDTLPEYEKVDGYRLADAALAALAPIRTAERQEAAREAVSELRTIAAGYTVRDERGADPTNLTGLCRFAITVAANTLEERLRGRADVQCRTFWGTHGCDLPRGHDVEKDPHACGCCDCDDHEANAGQRSDDDGEWVCVARPPYYGPDTKFYGEDASPETTSQEAT
ncbi:MULTISPECIES: hypothetical protein [unclassified Aeromicrobium]|uniref:hypothetical protein n=1 Tax=unclassified Aeromicrobium TaxID=2633570 RepID=UPI00288AD55D|nr:MULTISPECIES: hypothetical protein [unclassified Aeromicrobium]